MKKHPHSHHPAHSTREGKRAKLRLTRAALKWFRFDRRLVAHQLDAMRSEARDNADQLEMIAAEGIFKSSLSKRFLPPARSYVELIRGLGNLRRATMRAKSYPGFARRDPMTES
jgi:hypothetical protein